MSSGDGATSGSQGGGIAAFLLRQGVLPIVLTAWAFLAYMELASFAFQPSLGPVLSTDDAMRLVQVRDLLAGQSWFDLTQYRLGAGVEMHWSRLVDAPLAVIILVLEPVLGRDGAETAMLYLWPILLALPALFATAIAGRALGGIALAWVATALMVAQMNQSGRFTGGQLDHHNVQLVLFIVTLAAAISAPRSRRAAACFGAAAAMSVGIGVELIPALTVLLGSFALYWVVRGAELRPALRVALLALILTLLAIFALTAPASAYRGGYCDAFGIDVALPLIFGAASLIAAATYLSDRGWMVRLAGLAISAGIALGGAAILAPACLSDPLDAIGPFLTENWLNRVGEVESLGSSIARNPGLRAAFIVSVAIGLISAAVLAYRRRDTWVWAMIGVSLMVALAISAMQLRGILLLSALTVLPAAAIVTQLFALNRRTGKSTPGFLAIVLGVLSIPMALDTAIWYVGGQERDLYRNPILPVPENENAFGANLGLANCYRPGVMDRLAELAPGLVSASSNLGPEILRQTRHRVLAAPYHRNIFGMTEQLRIALADDAEAERRLRGLGVDYLVVCLEDTEYGSTEDYPRTGFGVRLNLGEVPDFLEPLPEETMPEPDGSEVPSPVRVYRLRP